MKRFNVDDRVSLRTVEGSRGVVTKASAKGVEVKWANGNVVEITHLLAENILQLT